MRLTIELTDAEHEKIVKLGERVGSQMNPKRTLSPGEVIKNYLASAVVDGGGWEHPERASK